MGDQTPETAEQALTRIAEEAQQLAAEHNTASTDLVTANVPADIVRAQMADRRSALLRKQAELNDARKAMEAEMRAKISAAMASLEPMMKEVKQLQEGIWTVNLYLGRDEQIVPLRGGEPAPAEAPIHIRQLVLSMDEETAIHAGSGGIDHMDVEKFDKWLLADPAHLDQVLPETKGVVVLVPRRRGRDYGDPWTNAARNKENEQSYWLIRNGTRVYRMRTDFTVGKTILPKRTEFTDMFFETRHNWDTGQSERVLMEPGSRAWMDTEEKQNARQRHYMRSALILQGLLDRTSVFEPKPAYHVSTVNPSSYEAGHVVLITDAEEDRQLTTGREPFYEWLARLNGQLRPGMRIIGAFAADEFQCDTVDGRRWGSPHNRLTPPNGTSPQSNVIHYLDGRRGGGLVFKYARTDTVWDDDLRTFREPKTRASCVVYPGDKYILPFDLVTVDEMRTYLDARLERHAYEDMFPLLKKAIALKEAEVEAEAPMRQLIVGALLTAGASHVDAELAMPSLVDWWKLANRWHRPLVSGDDLDEAKAVKSIVAEYKRRQAATADPERDAEMIAWLRDPATILIAQRRDGRWVVLRDQDGADAYERAVAPKTWCAEFTYPRTGQGEADMKEWVLPGARPNQWRTVWERDDWATWNRAASASDHLSGPELDVLADEARRSAKDLYGDRNHYLGTTYQIAEPGDVEVSTVKVWMMPIDADDDSSYPVRYSKTWWSRTTGGRVAASHGVHTYSQSYSGEQLFGRFEYQGQRRGPALLDVDESVVDQLNARVAARAEVRKARDAEWQALWTLERTVEDEWRRRAIQREYEKFMDDYRDETLWPAHQERLTIRYPHPTSHRSSYNGDSDIMQMLRALVADGQEVTGRTVADLAAAYAVLGHTIKVPDDIADITVQGPDQEEQEA